MLIWVECLWRCPWATTSTSRWSCRTDSSPRRQRFFCSIFFSSSPNQVAIISLLTICHPYCRHFINQFCQNSGRRHLWSEFCHLWFPPRWCLRFGETIEIGSQEYQWGHPWGWWWWFWPRWGWFWSWTSIAIYWKYAWQFASEKDINKN